MKRGLTRDRQNDENVALLAQEMKVSVPIDQRVMIANFLRLPIGALLQTGIEPWMEIVKERPIALLNLMRAHPILYALFAQLKDLWIILLEQVILRETSPDFYRTYFFQMIQHHTLFEGGKNYKAYYLDQDNVSNRVLGYLEECLFYQLKHDLFKDDNKRYVSIFDLYETIDASYSPSNSIQEYVLQPFSYSDSHSVKRPRFIVAYIQLMQLIFGDDNHYNMRFIYSPIERDSLFAPLVAHLREWLFITPIEDSPTGAYTLSFTISWANVKQTVDKERGERIVALANEVIRLGDEILFHDSSDDKPLNLQSYRDAVFGPKGLYNTPESQRALFLSELKALFKRRFKEAKSAVSPRLYFEDDEDDVLYQAEEERQERLAYENARQEIITAYGEPIYFKCRQCGKETELIDKTRSLAFCGTFCLNQHTK